MITAHGYDKRESPTSVVIQSPRFAPQIFANISSLLCGSDLAAFAESTTWQFDPLKDDDGLRLVKKDRFKVSLVPLKDT